MIDTRTRLPDLLSCAARERGASPALTYANTTLSYVELWHLAGAVATGLADAGVSAGERVAVYLDKRIETVAAIFGSAAADAVFVPVNPLLRAQQVAHILDDCEARVLVTSPERLTTLDLAACKSVELVVVLGSTPEPDEQARYRLLGWDDLIAAEPSESLPGLIDTDVAAILYTSGSTGAPKGVVLSHRNLVAGAESVASYLGNSSDDVILAVLPLSFDAGLSQLTTGFRAGAHVVLMNYLMAGDVLKLCAKHQVTGLTCVPPLWIQLAEKTWPEEASRSLRYFANTGGRMPKATLDRLRATFPGAKPYLMYGLTEAFRSTYLDPAEVDRRPDSIGKAIPNAEILVVRPDGTECEPGEEGELVHRGALVALGYWNDPERTAARFKPAPGRLPGVPLDEPAVWSGDRVVRDADGFLYFIGRMDDMIKTSGYRVSPTEIEEVGYESGLVRDIVALGLDDPRLGQRVVLVVTPANGAELEVDKLLAAYRERLPRFMHPADVVVVDELPRSPNGKFDRTRIRAEVSS